MPVAKVSAEEFVRVSNQLGSPTDAAKALGLHERNWYDRKARLEKKGHVFDIRPKNESPTTFTRFKKAYPKVITANYQDGIVLVGSDAHYWPGYVSTAHRAFVEFCKHLKPVAVVLNGDIFDFPAISRHHRIGFATQPLPAEELDEVVVRVEDIEAVTAGVDKFRTPGNHCIRLEGFVSNHAPQLEGIPGSKLSYYLPNWKPAWAIHLNDQLWITHRLRSGVHAPWNNTINMGQSTCTGHLHSLKVYPVTDLNGTRYGVDCGTLAEVDYQEDWPQFEYVEGNIPNWRSGFAVFTFKNGKLLPPELVQVLEPGKVYFRGGVIEV